MRAGSEEDEELEDEEEEEEQQPKASKSKSSGSSAGKKRGRKPAGAAAAADDKKKKKKKGSQFFDEEADEVGLLVLGVSLGACAGGVCAGARSVAGTSSWGWRQQHAGSRSLEMHITLVLLPWLGSGSVRAAWQVQQRRGIRAGLVETASVALSCDSAWSCQCSMQVKGCGGAGHCACRVQ